ncbi:unnamed protein product [Calypogeia fissa]
MWLAASDIRAADDIIIEDDDDDDDARSGMNPRRGNKSINDGGRGETMGGKLRRGGVMQPRRSIVIEQTGGCGMDFKRLAKITRKIVKRSKRIPSSSEVVSSPICQEMSIFVKLPSNSKSIITLMVEPLDKVAAIKVQIQEKTRYLVARQSLFFSGKQLDDRETLAAYNISKDSTVQLKVNSDVLTSCEIKIQVLPINRFVSLRIPQGLTATIRQLKDLMFMKEGIVCEALYLDDDITGEQLADNVTLAACRVTERTLVFVQSEIDFSAGGSPSYSGSKVNCTASRALLDAVFEEAFNTKRTVPGLEDMEPVEVPRDLPEQNSQLQGPVMDIETAIATMLESHQHCERKLTLMLDEKNRLQMDLLELQRKYPKLLSDVLEERNKLQRDLRELRSEFPRQLSLVRDEKNKLQQQLLELQSEYPRQMSLVLDENSYLQTQVDSLKIDLGREREKSLCNICFDKPRDTLVFSCLHLHFCSSCLQKHQERTNTCPTCRGFISGKLICNVSI